MLRSLVAVAEQADRGGDDERPEQRAGDRVAGDEQAGGGAGEGQLGGAVHGERHVRGSTTNGPIRPLMIATSVAAISACWANGSCR